MTVQTDVAAKSVEWAFRGNLGPSHESQMLGRLGLSLFESFLKKIDHF